MSSLESSKNLAGIGAILLIFSFIPVAGLLLGIVGVILLLMGMKGLADYYQDHSIYQNALMGVIYLIIGIIATFVVLIGFIFGTLFGGILAVGLLILAVIVLFVFYLLGAMSFRKAFSTLAQKSGEHMFETAGFILYIGAILTIILVGLALVLVAWILLAIAFFSMKVPSQQYAYTPSPSVATPAPTQATRYCPNCGAPVAPNTAFCPHCGKQLPP
jgi:uncharacterized membrane protein